MATEAELMLACCAHKIFANLSRERLKEWIGMRPTKAALILCLMLGLSIANAGCQGEYSPAPEHKGPGTALMLMDLQRDYLQADGRRPVAQDQVEPMIKAVNEMIAAMRKTPMPVIYVIDEYSPFQFVSGLSNNWAAQRYEAGSAIDPRVNGTAGVFFRKQYENIFRNDQFVLHMKIIDSGTLAVAGVYADSSVLVTVEQALRRGYHVIVISDAVAAKTDQAREAALNRMRQAGAKIETSGEFISSLGGAQKAA
jgi:nicotinamidase-related amidase